MDYKCNSAEFLLGAKKLEQCPESELPEVAFIGRSNAGKSTLINKITQKKKLARTSSQPGKTREINFFNINFSAEEENFDLILTDLPGFGYAKFAKTEREELSQLTVEYLMKRENLKIVFLIHDSKRLKVTDEELALQQLLYEANRHIIIVASKCDRLKQSELSKNVATIAKAYGLEREDLICDGSKANGNKIFSRINDLVFI
ncbi:UNVERIFIED_CONTAM: hypothetical protein GTU68_056463 [Idotea baltica]|nr:hypothetical protein [Idotea baltica]